MASIHSILHSAYVAAAASIMLASMVSCEYTFDIDNDADPEIFVSCLPVGDTILARVQCALPASASSETVVDFHPSSVVVKVNGDPVSLRQVGEEEGFPDGCWLAVRHLAAGDVVDIAASADGMHDVNATSTVPETPIIKSLVAKYIHSDDSTTCEQVSITLGEMVKEGDRYAIQITRATTVEIRDSLTDKVLWGPVVNYSSTTPGHVADVSDLGDVNLDSYASAYYDGRFFDANDVRSFTLLTDKDFDGATYTFYLDSYDSLGWMYWPDSTEIPYTGDPEFIIDSDEGDFPYGDWADYAGMESDIDVSGDEDDDEPIYYEHAYEMDSSIYMVTVYRLSDEAFFYAKAQYLKSFDFLSNLGLSPANFTYTNINGGLGILGAMSSCSTGWFVPAD